MKQKLKSLRQEKENGGVIVKSVRLNVALDQYLKNVKMSKVKDTTYDRVESTFKYHIQNEALGRMQIGAITSTDIQKHLNNFKVLISDVKGSIVPIESLSYIEVPMLKCRNFLERNVVYNKRSNIE